MQPRQPFYVKDMHNSTFYQNHRYFSEPRSKTQESGSHHKLVKEFVEVPQPFGVSHTYQYLRKANIRHLPDMNRSKRYSSMHYRHSRRSQTDFITNLRHSRDVFKTQITEGPEKRHSKHFSSVSESFRQDRLPISILLYDRFSEERIPQVQLDLMKYLCGCFLKCELKLETMSIDQFRILSEYIPAALASRDVVNDKVKYFVSQAQLGFNTTKTIRQMISKFLDFRDNNKTCEIFKLLNHYILPQDEVLEYQLGVFTNDLNSLIAKQFRQEVGEQPKMSLYIFNGNRLVRVNNLFELDTDMPIVASSDPDLDSKLVVKYRHLLMKKMKNKRNSASLFKPVERGSDLVNLAERNVEYSRIGQLLRRKQRNKISIKGRVKYKNPLLQARGPFIDKSKLVREHVLFQ